jgi:hypothetical protein
MTILNVTLPYPPLNRMWRSDHAPLRRREQAPNLEWRYGAALP